MSKAAWKRFLSSTVGSGGSRRGPLEADSNELQVDELFVDGHVGRLIFGSKKKFSIFRLSGLRRPRILRTFFSAVLSTT